MFQERDIRKWQDSFGKIGNGNREIHIRFPHAHDFAEAEKSWNRRKERVNLDRMFVKMSFGAGELNDEYLAAFDEVPLPKVYFGSGETDNEKVLYLKRYERYLLDCKVIPNRTYAAYLQQFGLFYKDVDVLKLLNGEEFLRET